MIKKVLSILFLTFSAVSVYSWNFHIKVINLYGNPDDKRINDEHSLNIIHINAIQEGNIIKISSDKESNAHVRITDSNGVVVRDEYIDLSQQENIVTLPDGNESKEYMIEIEFDDIYMYGYLNQ